MQPPNWSLSFELMCDASDYIIRAIMGQIKECKPVVIYYTSRNLNNAEMNCITFEKAYLR